MIDLIFIIKYREGCLDYVKGGVLDNPEKRYDELSNDLIDEENQYRQEQFDKLHLPESEMLKTETNAASFPENNKPVESSIKIDQSTLNDSKESLINNTKSFFSSVKSYREKKKREREEKIEKEKIEKEKKVEDVSNDITPINTIVENETTTKTIEELKDPNLASYPIIHPKTVEVIQQGQKEGKEDMKEAKEIVEPDVTVSKVLSQDGKDPYVDPKEAGKNKSSPKKSSLMIQRSFQVTVQAVKDCYHAIRQSDTAKQVIGVGIGCASMFFH